MPTDSRQEIYLWTREHVGQPIMLGYVLYKVNGQIPGNVLILLKQPTAQRPNAEIQITVTPGRPFLYQVSFSFLPFHVNLPRPDLFRVSYNRQEDVVTWLKTGYKLT